MGKPAQEGLRSTQVSNAPELGWTAATVACLAIACGPSDATPPIVAALTAEGIAPSGLVFAPTDYPPRESAPKRIQAESDAASPRPVEMRSVVGSAADQAQPARIVWSGDAARIHVLAFLDPTDDASRRLFATLDAWARRHRDIRWAVRLLPRPDAPNSAVVVRRYRALARPAFIEAWKSSAPEEVENLKPRLGVDGLQARRDADEAEARRLQVTAIPTVFINGFRLTGAMPVDNYEAVADRFRRALRAAPPPYRPHEANESDEPNEPNKPNEPSKGGVEAFLRPHLASRVVPPKPSTVRRRRVEAESDDPWRGAKAPLVTIQFFADLECPHTRSVWRTLKVILREHDDVQVRFRHRPDGAKPVSKLEARAAIAASVQGRFWPFMERLLGVSAGTDRSLQRIARTLGLSVRKFDADRKTKAVHDKLDADRRAGNRLHIEGTPVLSINGVTLLGDMPRARIEDRIAVERARARRLIDDGVAPASLQTETVRRDVGRPVDVAPARRRGLESGPRAAPRVVLFIDPTCPFAPQAYDAVARVSAAQATPFEVHLVPRDVPFSRAAATLLVSARLDPQIEFEHALRMLFSRLPGIDGGDLDAVADALGWAEHGRFARRANASIDADVALARRAGVTAVPALFVDGVPMPDPSDVQGLAAVLSARSASSTLPN